MSNLYRIISKTLFPLALIFSFFLSGCSLLEEAPVTEERPLTEREQLFAQAEQAYTTGDETTARGLYSKLTRSSETGFDPVYDQSLLRLAKIYEKQDESEKALLTLDELSKRASSSISKNKIKFLQMKNHFRVTNFYQAREIKKQLDASYVDKSLSLYEIYENLKDTSDFLYDRHIIEELMFLGEVQKYYIFVIESSMSPENKNLTDQLINNYDQFFNALQRPSMSEDFKKQLSITLLDQLRRFDRYKMDDGRSVQISRFISYSERQQKKLTESFSK